MRSSRLGFDACSGQILEASDVIHLCVAHVLESFACQGRTAPGRAMQQDGLIRLEGWIVVLALRIGPKLQHAPRDVHRPF
jgi:hypothetical protein